VHGVPPEVLEERMQPASIAINLASTTAVPVAGLGNLPTPKTTSFAETLASKFTPNNAPQESALTGKLAMATPVQFLIAKTPPKAKGSALPSGSLPTPQNVSPPSAHTILSSSPVSFAPAPSVRPADRVAIPETEPHEQQLTSHNLASQNADSLQTQMATKSLPELPSTFLPKVLTNAVADKTLATTQSEVPQKIALLQQAAPPVQVNAVSDAVRLLTPEASAHAVAPALPSVNFPATVFSATTSANNTNEKSLPPQSEVQRISAEPFLSIETTPSLPPSPSLEQPVEKSQMATTEPAAPTVANAPAKESNATSQTLSPIVLLVPDSIPQLLPPAVNSDVVGPQYKPTKLSPAAFPVAAAVSASPTVTPTTLAVPQKTVAQPAETNPTNNIETQTVRESGTPSTGAASRKPERTTPTVETQASSTVETANPTTIKSKDQSEPAEDHHPQSQDAPPQKDAPSSENNINELPEAPIEPKIAREAKLTIEVQTTSVSTISDLATVISTSEVANNQFNAAPNPLVNERSATQASAKDSSSLPSSNDTQPSSVATPNNPPINDTHEIVNAQINGNGSQSEIHLAMQVDRLGPVELHAHVSGEQMGAAILVEKREAHAALAVELPALQQALSEKSLRVEHVWLTQSSLHSTAGDTGNANGQQSRQQSGARLASSNETETQPALLATLPEQDGIFDERGHLSVHA
jgi:Flagellar hook-length control protein FliK